MAKGWKKGKGGAERLPLAVRFWTKVEKTDDCWLWVGSKTKTGYGKLWDGIDRTGSGTIDAHRLSWILHFGPIPEEMYVCHRCDVKVCVRPDHLFLGTPKQNTADMFLKGRARPGGKISPPMVTNVA